MSDDKRDSSGRWLKGVSGNPSGRPKGHAEMRKHFQERAFKALEALDRILDNPDEIGSTAQLGAIREVFLRGWGKPETAAEIRRSDGDEGKVVETVVFKDVKARSDLDPEDQEALDRADE